MRPSRHFQQQQQQQQQLADTASVLMFNKNAAAASTVITVDMSKAVVAMVVVVELEMNGKVTSILWVTSSTPHVQAQIIPFNFFFSPSCSIDLSPFIFQQREKSLHEMLLELLLINQAVLSVV